MLKIILAVGFSAAFFVTFLRPGDSLLDHFNDAFIALIFGFTIALIYDWVQKQSKSRKFALFSLFFGWLGIGMLQFDIGWILSMLALFYTPIAGIFKIWPFSCSESEIYYGGSKNYYGGSESYYGGSKSYYGGSDSFSHRGHRFDSHSSFDTNPLSVSIANPYTAGGISSSTSMSSESSFSDHI